MFIDTPHLISQMTLTTPALLFPAISLLMLAYTNRFFALAALIRRIYADQNSKNENHIYHGQLLNLSKRLRLIRRMQTFGGLCFLLCVCSMISLCLDQLLAGQIFFFLSLLSLGFSLIQSIIEIRISLDALELELSDLEIVKREFD